MQEIRTHLPNLAWCTTFIVSFPTETEERFQELLEFVSAGHFQSKLEYFYTRMKITSALQNGETLFQMLSNMNEEIN